MEFPDPTLEEAAARRTWRERVPPFALAWRGVALGAFAFGAGRVALGMALKSPWLIPLALPVALVAFLLAWGSAVHLAGGQEYSDQDWDHEEG